MTFCWSWPVLVCHLIPFIFYLVSTFQIFVLVWGSVNEWSNLIIMLHHLFLLKIKCIYWGRNTCSTKDERYYWTMNTAYRSRSKSSRPVNPGVSDIHILKGQKSYFSGTYWPTNRRRFHHSWCHWTASLDSHPICSSFSQACKMYLFPKTFSPLLQHVQSIKIEIMNFATGFPGSREVHWYWQILAGNHHRK